MELGQTGPIPRPHFSNADGTPAEAASADLLERVSAATAATRDWLLARQHSAGYWCGELEGDSILESEYILLLAWLGREQSAIAKKCAAYLVEKQLPTGGWAMYPGGQLEISGSVKAYFALKLTGHDPRADYMRLARHAIREAGGADAVNSFTRFYLALLGQISYDHCPAVPPELVLLPNWSPINIYRMSAWSRTIVVPLSIMWAHRPHRTVPAGRGIRELFLRPPQDWPALKCPGLSNEHGWFSWGQFFRRADQALKWLESRRWTPLRRRALAAAERWMTTRFAHSDGLGAIFPPIIWSVIALKCRGFSDDSAEVRYNLDQLRALTIEQEHTARLQPCLSPVWDTAIALRALATSGLTPNDQAAVRSTDWLLDKEVTRRGDWAEHVKAAPAGWFFEHHNEFYPDVDDTAMVMIALAELNSNSQEPGVEKVESEGRFRGSRSRAAVIARRRGLISACERARQWLLAMQNRDGGWGAFDKDNDAEFLCRVPFADHNAMIDPSTPDLTGRAIEALAMWNAKANAPAIGRGAEFLRRTQERDGSWEGRWGVNYLYGTWQALVGLAAAGLPGDDPAIKRGANWLLTHQHACGGWGESADSYEQPEQRGQGPVTASQTAWALLGLIAAGHTKHKAVLRGIYYLLDTQRPDGGWDEPEFTGTGFPRVFYLRYHYYPIYFPLLAFATYSKATQQEFQVSSSNVQVGGIFSANLKCETWNLKRVIMPPLAQAFTVASYVLRQKLRGIERYPLVLMLEPLFRCNLACAGCGKIQFPAEILRRHLTPEQCWAAADECGAPIVSIPGGEPLLHPQIDQVVAGLVARERFIYLCTNALKLEESLSQFKPSKYLAFSVHLDGPREEHDHAVCRAGTYDIAVQAIRAARQRGFRVTTNTTLFKGADPERMRSFFDELMCLGVEGMTISPGYSYAKAPDQEHFLSRSQTIDLFRFLLARARRSWRFNQTPLFLEFLRGNYDLECQPWGSPSYSIFGWQRPCYLLGEGYCQSFRELMETTAWDAYGRKSGNPKCRDCMVHCGYEPSAVAATFGSLSGFLRTTKATLLGIS